MADTFSPDAGVAMTSPPSGGNADRPMSAVKLFVGQLPKAMDEAALKPVFMPYGNVVDVQIIRDRATMQSRGCCFVTFQTQAEADRCIEMLHNRHTMPGLTNPIQVKYADGERERLEHKLFIGQLPKSSNEDEIRQILVPYGSLEELKILRDPAGASRGCGFVKYTTRESALAAIASLDGKYQFPSGLTLTVKFAEGTKEKEKKRAMAAPMPMGYPPNPYAAYGGGYPSGYGAPMPGYGPAGAQAGYAAPNPYAAAGYGAGGYGGYGYPQQVPPVMSATPNAPKQQEGPPGANLFIYHCPHEWRDHDLAAAFAPFGAVISAKVFIDKATNQSKGFGFVSYDNPGSAAQAISSMDGFAVGANRLKVSLKRDKGPVGGARLTPY